MIWGPGKYGLKKDWGWLDQDLGSTDTQKESQSLLEKEKVDEESNRAKLSAKLCNEMFSWSLDLEQDNI